jgi:hypothetical protein
MISAPRLHVGLRLGAGGQTIEQLDRKDKILFLSNEQNVFTVLYFYEL